MNPRPLRFWDLALYALAMCLSIRWIATAAAAGPASLPLWGAAVLGFMAPLVIATAELTGRFSGEGGIYAWSRDALGPFAGFVCGWLYWTCNLPFFSGLLYFVVAVLGSAFGRGGASPAPDPALFAGASCALALLIASLHLAGLGAGKWLSNFGAAAGCALFLALILAGAAVAAGSGPATDFVHASYAPPLDADGAALWATMVFAFGGPEALAFLRADVKGGTGGILRVLAVVGVLATLAYILGTVGVLAILRPQEASRLSGVPDALRLAFARLGLSALTRPALILLALAMLGGYSAWFGVAARLPFVVGVDRYLPAAFARRDPRSGAPVAAILVQALAVIALVLLSQAGSSVKAAYDFLVSMSVLSYTLPFLFLFAVYLKVQARAAPAGQWSTPGGALGGRLVGAVGVAVTLSAIACTLVPSPEAADKPAVVARLVLASAILIGSGVIAYGLGRGRRSRRLTAPTPP